MRYGYLTAVSVSFILLLTACKKNDSSSYGALPVSYPDIYPLVIGHEWKYYREFRFTNDSTHVDSLFAQDYLRMRVDRNQTLSNGDVTFAMVYEDSSNATITNIGTGFYYISSTGLYNPAYVMGTSSPVYLIHQQPMRFKIEDLEFSSLQSIRNTLLYGAPDRADSIIFDSPARLVIKHPLNLNDEWNYITYPWIINKKYLGDEMVPTPFGNFLCKKLEWFYDLNSDGTWDDMHVFQYISPVKGMLKEIFTGEVTLTDNGGNPVGTGTFLDESIVTSVNF